MWNLSSWLMKKDESDRERKGREGKGREGKGRTETETTVGTSSNVG